MPRHRFANTRDRIERAALELFVAKGVGDTSVRDLARATGLSEGALYRHFESKEQLVLSLFERHYLAFARELESAGAGEAGARGKIAAMVRAFCRAHDADPTLFRFLLFVQHEELQRVRAAGPTPVAAVRAVVEAGIAAGEIPDQPLSLATALVFGIVLEPAQFAAYGELPPRMLPLSDRLVAAVWAALTSAPEEKR